MKQSARSVRRATAATRFLHPAQLITGGFAAAVAVGTGLLSLPFATASGERADPFVALFTATSAVCLTGLTTVDTGSYWSMSGEIVILLLIQVGGLGIMTLATLFAVLFSHRLGLRARLLVQAETKALTLRGLRRVVRNIALFSLAGEAITAVMLTVALGIAHDRPWGNAAFEGIFHAVSAFNNAGLSPYANNLHPYVGDPWVCLPVTAAVIVGGLGFPVVFELGRAWRRPRTWSVLTRITLVLTVTLLAVGTVALTAAEYGNPRTLGPLSGPDKWLAGFFASVVSRTAGFSTVETGGLRPESVLVMEVLMFIGGGSASTAGGIKVTTFGLLAFVMWAEVRGKPSVEVGRRQVPVTNQRQALSISLMSIGVVVVAAFLLLALSDHRLHEALFEAVSAFSTVGLTTGITGDLSTAAQVVLLVVMFTGRVGPLTLAYALALRERTRRYELPEERIIVG